MTTCCLHHTLVGWDAHCCVGFNPDILVTAGNMLRDGIGPYRDDHWGLGDQGGGGRTGLGDANGQSCFGDGVGTGGNYVDLGNGYGCGTYEQTSGDGATPPESA